MTENMPNPVSNRSLCESLAEGGALGAILGRPVADAIGRLIGGATSIPAAYLEAIAQRIRDDSEARTRIIQSISEVAADNASQDNELVGRMLNRWLHTEKRRQTNRESIAEKSISYMIQDGLEKPLLSAPSDDFMNNFERISENSSSTDMQNLFAKILSGECRKPGSFSLSALNVFSVMDKPLASAIEKANSWVFDNYNFIVFSGPFTSGVYLDVIMQLSDFNLIRFGTLGKNFKMPDSGSYGFSIGHKGFVLNDEPGRDFRIDAAILTPVGEQVMSIIDKTPQDTDITLIAEQLKAIPLRSVQVGNVSVKTKDTLTINDLTTI
jgi:hypothetical protein